MKTSFKFLLGIFLMAFALIQASFVFAQTPEEAMKQEAENQFIPGLDQKANPFNDNLVGDLRTSLPREFSAGRDSNPLYLINRIVQILLSFIGIGSIGLMVYAGYLWMTSGGSDEQVGKAKRTLRNALIGFVLIMMSYSLTIFIARRIQRETGSYGVGNTYKFSIQGAADAIQ